MKTIASQNSGQSGLLMGGRELDTTLLLPPSFSLRFFAVEVAHTNSVFVTGLSLRFHSPVLLIFTPVTNLLLYE